MVRLAILACVLGLGCKRDEPPRAAPPAPGVTAATPKPAADPCARAHAEGPIAWIADDYPSALACARQKKLPIVVDLWAPWCHTCLSMQTTVFTDPSFAADRERFVFLALDTDRETNAPALTHLSISAWPTFYVLGPDEAVLARFVGAATVAQFHELLDSGARAQGSGQSAADARLLGANRALAVKDLQTADEELTAALAAAPAAWLRRTEVLGSLLLTKLKHGDLAGCLTLAEKYLDETGTTSLASDFVDTAMSCAEARAKDEPARVKALRERGVARWKQLLADGSTTMSIDDRSGTMASLRETLDALGRPDEAKAIAKAQRALLDEAAAKAPTPMAAMTYNWPRAEVYVYLGVPLELVPALEKSARELPGEYDPRARLGWIYLRAHKLAEAATWTDDALKLVYGPRKGRLLIQRADVAAAADDKATEKKFRQAAVDLYAGLPAGQQQPDALAKAREALAALDAPAGSGSAPAGK